jgi:hypothetical protein
MNIENGFALGFWAYFGWQTAAAINKGLGIIAAAALVASKTYRDKLNKELEELDADEAHRRL